MRGTLWCQCFCPLMRRELSFLSVCNFLVCPWPWQLAYVKPINPQRSLRCHASGLCTHTRPCSSSIPLFSSPAPSAVFTSATVQRTWGMFVFFSSSLFSLSSFSLLSPPEYQTMNLHFPPHLDFSSISSSGCSPFPVLGFAVAFSKRQLWEPTPPFLGHLGISCSLQAKSLSVSAGYSCVRRRGRAHMVDETKVEVISG